MQPFDTESLHDRNLRLAYFAEQERHHRVFSHTSGQAWRRAIGRRLIGLGSRLSPGPD